MAISTTYTKKQEELARNQQPVTSNKAYSGMAGVSQNTANNLGNYQQGYQQGQQAQQAQQNLQAIQAQKPQDYASKYGAQLDNLLQQIQNPGQFKYEFNGDNLFKYYADLYTQKGKQASMDAMGQAAALTGGYGNSYGQQVGQQQYQQYLLNLYDRGMDLRDRAYQQYQDQLGNQKDAYQLMAQAEDTNYGRYRDTVGDWMNERAYATERADVERDFDYNQYMNDLQYWTGLAQIENAAYNTEAERQEAIRQYNQDFAEKQRQYDTSMAEQIRQADLDEAYRRDTLGWQQETDARDYAERVRQYDTSLAEQQRQADMDNAYRYNALAQDQAQFDATTKLNYDKLAQDQAQFEASLSQDEKQDYRRYAVEYVSSILANGQIPSNELLVAAGLSWEDAQKLVAQVAPAGGYNPGTTGTGITPQQAAEANWNQFKDNYFAADEAERERQRAEATAKNTQTAIANNKKTGALTGKELLNYITKQTK